MSLTAKAGATAILVLLAELVFDIDSGIGSVIGGLAIAWLVALVLTRPVVLRSTGGRIAASMAAGYALLLIDDPRPLALLLFATAVSLATLLPGRRFGHALLWVPRLARHALIAIPAPLRDWAHVSATRRRRSSRSGGVRATAAMLVVPVIGGALFVLLFATANPLIGEAFDRIALPDGTTTVWRTVLGGIILVGAWASLRPRPIAARDPRPAGTPIALGAATLVVSLATFNLIFAGQNALDILFLWSGAPLPGGVTMADYAHRGAYTLIATALLAAMFVLVTLRPGSASAGHPGIRRLVSLWIVQNLLLVASSVLRLLDYVAAYSMTALRLAALLWMALVAAGLVLILWRLLRARSTAWLVNANAVGVALVLSLAATIDLAATAAAWNTRVALRPGGASADLCYLADIGASGVTSLALLERQTRDPARRDAIAALRWAAQVQLAGQQSNWRSWTWRDARRLAEIERLAGTRAPRLRPAPAGRVCGEIMPPDPDPAAAPLTKAPQR